MSEASVHSTEPGTRARGCSQTSLATAGRASTFPGADGAPSGADPPGGDRWGLQLPSGAGARLTGFARGLAQRVCPPPRGRSWPPSPFRGRSAGWPCAERGARTHLGRAPRRHPAPRPGLYAQEAAAPGPAEPRPTAPGDPRPPKREPEVPSAPARGRTEAGGAAASARHGSAPGGGAGRGRGAPPILDKGPGPAGTLVA